MADEYFASRQEKILEYKNYLDKHNVVLDKTNKIFLDLILNILQFLGSAKADMLDEQCEYNIKTMRGEFEKVIDSTHVDEKSQAVLLTFFLRIAHEMKIKYGEIENEHFRDLHTRMTSKDFKYPSYIDHQKYFALEKLPENIKRMQYFGR